MSQPYIGEIRLFGGTFPPAGWAFCDGDLLPIAENEALFQLIGTTYGGDGQTTFALPDLRGRLPIGRGQGPGVSQRIIGEAGGQEQVTLTPQQLPVHSHPMTGASGSATTRLPSGSVPAATTSGATYTNTAPVTPMRADAVGMVGGSQPHENLMPSLAVHYIIALRGIFPPQD